MSASKKDSKDTNKIDLKDLNKKASVGRKRNPFTFSDIKDKFRKKDNYKRDQEGKFTAGSGGLKKASKRFNAKRAIPIIAVVSLVGGVLVFQSFATTGVRSAVHQAYRDCLGREGTSSEGEYYVKLVNNEGRTVQWVRDHFASVDKGKGGPGNCSYGQIAAVSGSSGGSTGSGSGSSAKRKATPAAKTPQQKVTHAHNWYVLASAIHGNAIKEREKADEISKKQLIARNDLRAIAQHESRVKSMEAQVNNGIRELQSMSKSGFSEQQKKDFDRNLKAVDDHRALIVKEISSISAIYKVAEKKHEDGARFFAGAQEAERRRAEQERIDGMPMFAVPRSVCSSGFQAARGAMTGVKAGDHTYSSIEAVTCIKEGSVPTSSNIYAGFNITKVGNVCASPYKKVRVNKVFRVGGRSAPDGIVCYRGSHALN